MQQAVRTPKREAAKHHTRGVEIFVPPGEVARLAPQDWAGIVVSIETVDVQFNTETGRETVSVEVGCVKYPWSVKCPGAEILLNGATVIIKLGGQVFGERKRSEIVGVRHSNGEIWWNRLYCQSCREISGKEADAVRVFCSKCNRLLPNPT